MTAAFFYQAFKKYITFLSLKKQQFSNFQKKCFREGICMQDLSCSWGHTSDETRLVEEISHNYFLIGKFILKK